MSLIHKIGAFAFIYISPFIFYLAIAFTDDVIFGGRLSDQLGKVDGFFGEILRICVAFFLAYFPALLLLWYLPFKKITKQTNSFLLVVSAPAYWLILLMYFCAVKGSCL